MNAPSHRVKRRDMRKLQASFIAGRSERVRVPIAGTGDATHYFSMEHFTMRHLRCSGAVAASALAALAPRKAVEANPQAINDMNGLHGTVGSNSVLGTQTSFPEPLSMASPIV